MSPSQPAPALLADAARGFFERTLDRDDPEVLAAIRGELARQQNQIELIASENIVSPAVLEAQGSVLTNKYAEGYPGKRYYGGCEYVDVAETLAIERVRRLFGCAFANVQPHSGASANLAVLFALARPGDVILGMSLAAGGHLTHGARPNFSGKWFQAVGYGVRRQDHRIDFDQVRDLAREHRPKVIIAGGSAYPPIIDFAAFRAIADEVEAYLMVDMAHFAGLVAAGVHPSPFPHAHVVTSTTHKTLRGPRGGLILADDEAIGKKINSAVFPGLQGGPLMHVIAAKAVAFGEALRPDFKLYGRQVVDNAESARRSHGRGRSRPRRGRHRHASDPGRSPADGADRQGRRGEPRARAHDLQQERHPVRSRAADRDLGHPPRQPGRDHPRLRRRRVPRDRPPDRRGPARPRRPPRRQRRRRDRGPHQGRGALRPLPDLCS